MKKRVSNRQLLEAIEELTKSTDLLYRLYFYISSDYRGPVVRIDEIYKCISSINKMLVQGYEDITGQLDSLTALYTGMGTSIQEAGVLPKAEDPVAEGMNNLMQYTGQQTKED